MTHEEASVESMTSAQPSRDVRHLQLHRVLGGEASHLVTVDCHIEVLCLQQEMRAAAASKHENYRTRYREVHSFSCSSCHFRPLGQSHHLSSSPASRPAVADPSSFFAAGATKDHSLPWCSVTTSAAHQCEEPDAKGPATIEGATRSYT